MNFDIQKLIAQRQGENYQLHHAHVNRTLVQVLGVIGLDKVYARASGAYLYDEDGCEYLDFISGYGVYNMGRNHPIIRKAITDVLAMDMPNMVQMDCSLLSGLLAEKLTAITPSHLDAVFFANSGTEAVEGALKFARAYTKKKRILSMAGGYHGLSYGSLSITANPYFQEGFGPFLPGVETIRFGDLNDLEAKLKAGDVAAFIAEPIQGKGVNLTHEAFFTRAQSLCRQWDALFICDEVQTGLGRTGQWFAFQHWDLEPDIITLAKALSGGYVPAAAVITRRKIYQRVFSKLDRCVVHSTTFGRNNLAMACGLAAIHVIKEEGLVENSRSQGKTLLEGLQALKDKHDLIREVRGRGCMIAIEFQQPQSLKLKMAWKAIHAVDKGLFPQMVVTHLYRKHRILTHVAGHNMDVVKILPPLIIGAKEIQWFVNALDDVLQDVCRFPGPLWDFGGGLVKTFLKNQGKLTKDRDAVVD